MAGLVLFVVAPFSFGQQPPVETVVPKPPKVRTEQVDGITFRRTDLDLRVLGWVEQPSRQLGLVVRMDADAPVKERHGHLLVGGTKFWDDVSAPILVVPGQELVLRVVIDRGDLPGTLTVSVDDRKLEPMEWALRDAGYADLQFLEYRYRPEQGSTQRLTVVFSGRPRPGGTERELGGLTVALPSSNTERKVSVDVGVSANIATFESTFGAFAVYREATKDMAMALRTPMLSLGRSSKLTLDAVTVFSDQQDIAIGGALTYSTLVGSRYYHSGRGVFGFPLRMNLSVGLEGLQLGATAQNRKLPKKTFFGFGFSIPTSEIKMGG